MNLAIQIVFGAVYSLYLLTTFGGGGAYPDVENIIKI